MFEAVRVQVKDFVSLGTVKSNLLLDKGRSYLEVQFCFDKYLEMSDNRSQAEKDVMVFCVGLYSQLAELEKKLQEQKKKEAWNATATATYLLVWQEGTTHVVSHQEMLGAGSSGCGDV